ncbi:succinate dehydrogenase/fumarate reductase, cytochrome b subunit [Gynuella sunshinyii YC6258]|uniref:Succinate dehydrogenase cytochrome b556 subunit n=2 Tax=Gynuella sunshinyii TaxID=1445505 RepID=A0A0C5VM30_9GAMM|nr:succinate dehydrogenase/fumarate reductase, cytochrome b subunit [Gynuella sunshinyii YC6258]
MLSSGIAKLILWVTVSAVLYHFVAGIKHLFMDMGIGESKESGPKMAIGVVAISAVLIVLAGVWIWA